MTAKVLLVGVVLFAGLASAADPDLLSKKPETRIRAQVDLVRSGDAATELIPELAKIMRDTADKYRSRRAAWALACVGESAIPILATEATRPGGCAAASDALVSLGKPAVPAVMEMVTSERSEFLGWQMLFALAPFADNVSPAIRERMRAGTISGVVAATALTCVIRGVK